MPERIRMNILTLSNAFKDLYAKIIKPLIADLDTPTFIAAGNEAFNSPIVNNIPAVLGGSIPDLIVVGAVDEDGDRAQFSQTADFVKVYAPGQDVETV